MKRSLIRTANKPIGAIRNSAGATDHVITDSIMSIGFKTVIIKTAISDHLPIFFSCVVIALRPLNNSYIDILLLSGLIQCKYLSKNYLRKIGMK